MDSCLKKKFAVFSLCMFIVASVAIGGDKPMKLQDLTQGFHCVAKTMPEGMLLAASSAVGSPAYHRHLVRSGALTTYMLKVENTESKNISVDLKVDSATEGWKATLADSKVELAPGGKKYVMLKVEPSAGLSVGDVATFVVSAMSGSGVSENVTLEAEITEKRKVYIISIDSLGTKYLELNSKGNGRGSEGDWLMPNLRSFIKEGTYYSDHKVHMISATDGNHAVYLSGAYPGRLGIYSVQIFFFGFDAKGRPIAKSTPLDIMYYGKDRKPVPTIFNVAKDPEYGGNPNAFTAYSAGKAWVPEHYRNSVFGLDRIATVNDYADYVTPYPHPHSGKWLRNLYIKVHLHKLKDPDLFAWEDDYTVDQTIETINNEDPDVFYILLSAVDMAGHAYGAGYDLDEWDDRGTPDDLRDDKSRINPHASREGIVKTVKNADKQFGRLLAYLKERGVYEDAIIAVQSDHNMETNYFDGPPLHKILRKTGYSNKKDYFVATINQIGCIFLRHKDDPEMAAALEKAMEEYTMENPVTGNIENPITVLNQEEMKTGIDNYTGKRVTFPEEVYSEYYVKYGKEGDLRWPDFLLLIDKYYQFPTLGAGLANVGASQIKVPPVHLFIGGHGSLSTQSALMAIRGPGIPVGEIVPGETFASDLVPTLYRLEGYKIPEAVQGKGLPKADPTLQ